MNRLVATLFPAMMSAKEFNLMGEKLAETYFKGHQFVIVTHNDTGKTHNHIVVNPVHMETGKRVQNKKKHIIRIKNGNYTPEELVKYLNKYVFSPAFDVSGQELRRVGCFYDKINKKISFFRDTRSKTAGNDGGLRDGFKYDDTTPIALKKYYFNIDWRLSEDQNRSIQLNMGWILGYRKQYYDFDKDYVTSDKVFYDNIEGFGTEACYQNTFGNRYIFLSLDDYNKNFAKSLISPFENSIINDINIFAKMNNYYDTFNYTNGDVDYQYKRSYFGPVDLMKLRIKLLDKFGRIVDLNNSDYSFTIRVEQLYDST